MAILLFLPPTTAFRSLLSNRGGFSPSLEPSQQRSHPRRNHLAKSHASQVSSCKEVPAVREVEGVCMREILFQALLPMAARVTGVRTEV